ncbi:hypothetical protein [Streptomyces coffeae]|uniref:Uncharacterized protein n=1 Tax=Streptomyces coffeae TaxID=621382 RepID=A0ABS1NDT1_9ACTN|nr:hypothetical protein [Streptomyces coffeae]MBL1098241.1 hypothetical protein [Streptomyces coffeae]
MIRLTFSVRPDQGEPSGFDLGDMEWVGDFGRIDSQGHVPDQGMMIYLSVSLLLDQLRVFLDGSAKTQSYHGIDTSFRLVFRRGKRGISISAGNGVIARVDGRALAEAVLRAADEMTESHLGGLDDRGAGRADCLASLREFRAAVR